MIGLYDIHTHFIPNVDDGSSSMEETIQLLNKEYNEGVRTIYLTSHYRKGMFEPDVKFLVSQYKKVRIEAAKIAPDLRVLIGCEFHANMDMIDTLNRIQRPTMGMGRAVLVEFSDRWNYEAIKERCYALLSNGYDPIIAHIERYSALLNHLDRVEELVNMGAYIQINADSFLGIHGLKIKMFANKVMKHDLLHFVASDGHNMTNRKPNIGPCVEYIEKKMGTAYVKKIFIDNPYRIIELNKKTGE